MHTCMMHTLKDISREPIGYSYNTKSALMWFEGARHTFRWYSNMLFIVSLVKNYKSCL